MIFEEKKEKKRLFPVLFSFSSPASSSFGASFLPRFPFVFLQE